MELMMHERNQPLEGVEVAFAPFEEESGDVGLRIRDGPILDAEGPPHLPGATFQRQFSLRE
jgi:hypothetical protein